MINYSFFIISVCFVSPFLSILSCLVAGLDWIGLDWIGLVFAVFGLTFVMPFGQCLYTTNSVKTLVVGFDSGNEGSLFDRGHVTGNKQFHTTRDYSLVIRGPSVYLISGKVKLYVIFIWCFLTAKFSCHKNFYFGPKQPHMQPENTIICCGLRPQHLICHNQRHQHVIFA